MTRESQLRSLEEEYKICKERSHQPSEISFGFPEGPMWNICKWCQTEYRFETILNEKKAPESTQ